MVSNHSTAVSEKIGKGAKIFIAGHRGLIGSAIVRRLKSLGYFNLVLPNRQELNLISQVAVEDFYVAENPDYVIVAAARVGGIWANENFPADFIYENLMIEANLIHGAYKAGVKKLLFLGSTCIYPKFSPQPMSEEYLLTGPLEPTNQWYAVAKIAGVKLCQAYHKQYGCCFVSALPTNLYGPGDNFDLATSHVLPALIRKFHEAKKRGAPSVEIWGTGHPRREFCFVDDAADACVFLLNYYDSPEPINIGVGEDISINELAILVQDVVGFRGSTRYNPEKADGTPRKLVDVRRLFALGWRPRMELREGIERTYAWFLNNFDPAAA